MRGLIIFATVGILQLVAVLAVVDYGKHLSDVRHSQAAAQAAKVEMFAGKL